MPHPYLKEIKNIYAANADATIAKGAKAYLLDQFEFYGIKTPLRRQICKAFYKAHPIKVITEFNLEKFATVELLESIQITSS
jgi:3-methyladenine DNA glycosylase AlkD